MQVLLHVPLHEAPHPVDSPLELLLPLQLDEQALQPDSFLHADKNGVEPISTTPKIGSALSAASLKNSLLVFKSLFPIVMDTF